MTGITFSLAMDCRTRGVPYIAARQLDIEETYRPARRRKPAHMFIYINILLFLNFKKAYDLGEKYYTKFSFNLGHPLNQLGHFQFTKSCYHINRC
jgi:hypothetical protein